MLNLFILFASSTVYVEEHFAPGWEKNWSRPEKIRPGLLLGKFRSSAGSYYADEKKQRGLETMDAHRYYLFYTNFSQPLDTREKDLIIQYTVRLDMYIDCAGSYIKILGPPTNPLTFSNESDYSIMFGPDICGATLHQTKVRLGYNGQHFDIKKNINAYKDHLTHGYTLIIRKNGTIEVRIDNEIKAIGKLSEMFDVPNVVQIPDPASVKPEDWDDTEFIIDENDKKPDDWVDDEFIEDPDSFKPPSFDDSMPWAPPMIKNPDYIGEWKPRYIKNPKYKGIWKPKMIDVDPIPDPTFGFYPSLTYLGIDVFQSCPGSIMGNFLVTDDEEYAYQSLKEAFLNIRGEEIKTFDSHSDQLQRERETQQRFDQNDYDSFKRIDAMSSDGRRKSKDPIKDEKLKKAEKIKKLKKEEAKKKASVYNNIGL